MVRAEVSAYFLGALLLLTLPLNWLLAAVAAAAFHELCHILAVLLSGGRIFGVRIGVGGAVIETSPMTRGRELVCSLAGPVGSLLLVLACRRFPRLAICGFLQGVFNLLPVFPLDGGRVLRCGVQLIAPRWADRISTWVENGTLGTLCALGVAGTVWWNLGLLPLLMALLLGIKAVMRKRPCKYRRFGVQ